MTWAERLWSKNKKNVGVMDYVLLGVLADLYLLPEFAKAVVQLSRVHMSELEHSKSVLQA